MPGTPFASVLTEEELAVVAHAAVADVAHDLTLKAFRDPREPAPTVEAAVRRDALAELRVLMHLQIAIEAHMRAAAAVAAEAGAGYPELGNACGITRQGARRRWPGLATGEPRPTPVPHLQRDATAP